MSFMKKYFAFWEKIDTALGSFENGIRLWEAERRSNQRLSKAYPRPYKRWADSPHRFKTRTASGPLLKCMNVLYENRFSRWLAGK